MIKAVFFDLDSTLIDFIKMKRIASEQAASAMVDSGLDMDKQVASQALFTMYLEVGIESEVVFSKFLEKFHGECEAKMLSAAINRYLAAKSAFLDPYPRVIPTFIQLIKWGIKLAIVTDAPRLKAWQRLNAMRLNHFFDVVVTFDDTLKRKPHRAPFENALKKLNLKPGECMMVGDWIDRDIEGAKKVGMKTCFARYGWQKALGGDPDKSGADYVIDKFDDILNIIQRENKES